MDEQPKAVSEYGMKCKVRSGTDAENALVMNMDCQDSEGKVASCESKVKMRNGEGATMDGEIETKCRGDRELIERIQRRGKDGA